MKFGELIRAPTKINSFHFHVYFTIMGYIVDYSTSDILVMICPGQISQTHVITKFSLSQSVSPQVDLENYHILNSFSHFL